MSLSPILLSTTLSLLPCSYPLYSLCILEHAKPMMLFKCTLPSLYLEYTSTAPSIFYLANFQSFIRIQVTPICEQNKGMFNSCCKFFFFFLCFSLQDSVVTARAGTWVKECLPHYPLRLLIREYIFLFTHSFNTYLFSVYHVLGTALELKTNQGIK